MTGRAAFILIWSLAATATMAASDEAPVYVLNGYRFEGSLGQANTAGLVAKLKHHPGARVREADIKADVDLLAKELHARHLRGRLYTGFAESDGHLWVYFHLAPLAPPQGGDAWLNRHLEAQHFEGPPGLAGSAMAAATGLKHGDAVSTENIDDARRGLLELYAKSRPGKRPLLQLRVERLPAGRVSLTWILRDRN